VELAANRDGTGTGEELGVIAAACKAGWPRGSIVFGSKPRDLIHSGLCNGPCSSTDSGFADCAGGCIAEWVGGIMDRNGIPVNVARIAKQVCMISAAAVLARPLARFLSAAIWPSIRQTPEGDFIQASCP